MIFQPPIFRPKLLRSPIEAGSIVAPGGFRGPITHIIEVGDSITDRSTVLNTPYNAIETNPSGWGAALRIVSGQRLQGIMRGATGVVSVPGNDRDFGYSGINAGQYRLGAAWGPGAEWLNTHVPIQAVEAAAASAPQGTIIVCHIGTNDLTGADAATAAARITALWARLVATGLPVVGTDILQRGAAYSGWTTTLRDRVNAVNTILRASWASSGLWAYRQWDHLIDKDVNGYAATTEFPVDHLHPTSRTGFRLAVDLWSVIQPYVTASPYTIPASGSASWVTPNPYVTGGTTLATSWEANSLGTLNTDYTVAKVTDGDGTVWQRLTRITPQSFEQVGLRARITSGIPATGTVCRATARIRMAAGQPAQSVCLLVQQVGKTPSWFDAISHGGATAAVGPIREIDGSWRFLSEEFTIQSGVTQVWCLVALKNSGSATIDFREAGIFRTA
jgi:hypothetical protein